MATSDLASIMDHLKTIAANIVEIKAIIVEIKADMSAMSGKLDTLSDNFDLFKGEANERQLRQRVQKLYEENSAGDSLSRVV